jgi:cation:H+ antiporter
MVIAFLSITVSMVVLIWSANQFVGGAAATARHFGMPPLLIGMVVVGFGTSVPELLVSGLAAANGNPGIALGNAYGSNITNIALILGIMALLSPITVHSGILRKELPILLGVTALTAWLLRDGTISRADSVVLLTVFAVLMGWAIRSGLATKSDALGSDMDQQLEVKSIPIGRAVQRLVLGLVLLIVSSRVLVWGAVQIAVAFGVSDMIIGLTVVAIGTSLPELASSIVAARKGEHDIVLGNIVGSNLFNTLAVVGLAGVIQPMSVGPEVLTRDVLVMAMLTVVLFVFGYGFRGAGRINRIEGLILLVCYIAYVVTLICTSVT